MANVVVELTGDEAKLLRSMQKVIEQQSKMSDGFKNVGKNSNTLQTSLDKSIGSLKTMAASALTVDVVFQAIGVAQAKFIERMETSVTLVKSLAAAQQEAAKNLAGTPQAAISDVLLNQVPRIAEQATFSDLPKITTALGSVSSIVGEQNAPSIVEAAANVTRFTKDDLQTTATATADVVKASGLKDGREAMSLLLTSGAVARPEELPKLATGASKSILAGVNASPTQNPIEAAKESAALFAMMSKVDKNGESAATASIQLVELMRETFKPTRDEELKRAQQIRELLEKQAVTQEESLRIEHARLTLQAREEDIKRIRPTDKSPKAELARLGVEEAKSNLVEVQKDAGLTPKESEELRRLQVQASYAGKDPGTFQGRLEAVRKDPELMRTVESNFKGEAAFRPIMQGLLDANSVHSKELSNAIATVSTDVAKFNDAMQSMIATPQQSLALASEKVDTSIAIKQFKNVELQRMGTIDDIVKKALKENQATGIQGVYEAAVDFLPQRFGIDMRSVSSMSSDSNQAVDSAIATLKQQQFRLSEWATADVSKMAPETQAKIGNLQAIIDTLEQMGTATKKADAKPIQAIEQPIQAERVQVQAIAPPPPPPQPPILESFSPSAATGSARAPAIAGDDLAMRIAQAAESSAKASQATAAAIAEQNRMIGQQTEILSEMKSKGRNPGEVSAALRAQLLAGQNATSN